MMNWARKIRTLQLKLKQIITIKVEVHDWLCTALALSFIHFWILCEAVPCMRKQYRPMVQIFYLENLEKIHCTII